MAVRRKKVLWWLGAVVVGCILLRLLAGLVLGQRDAISNSVGLVLTGSKPRSTALPWVQASIVDQHQEVLPYWLHAIEDGKVPRRDNVLIHIDAHSDFGTPELAANETIYSMPWPLDHVRLFSLMHNNDDFIQSAAMMGVFTHVVWIYPAWIARQRPRKAYFGVGISHSKKGPAHAYCMKMTSAPRRKKSQCFIFSRESEDYEVAMNCSECEVRTTVQLLMVSEDESPLRLLRDVPIASQTYVLDFDEDYFGVSRLIPGYVSGFPPREFLAETNSLVGLLFCPTSAREEAVLSTMLTIHLDRLVKGNRTRPGCTAAECMDSSLEKTLLKQHKHLLCSVESFAEDLQRFSGFMLSTREEHVLRVIGAGFCFPHSPSLPWDKEDNPFRSCLVDPEFFVPEEMATGAASKRTAIQPRARRVTKILTEIFKVRIPSLITVARSMRDGFMLKKQFREIEDSVIKAFETSSKNRFKIDYIYDENLFLGQRGWPAD